MFSRSDLTKISFAGLAVAVILYSVVVLYYSATSVDLGIRCLFTSDRQAPSNDPGYPGVQVRRAYPEAEEQLAEGSRLPQKDDVVVKVGRHRVPTFIHFNAAMVQIRRDADELNSGEGLPDDDAPGLVMRKSGDETKVKVVFYPSESLAAASDTEPAQPVGIWCRVKTPPRRPLVLSFVWFAFEAMTFTLGALVFWRRPQDESVRLFFLMCILTVAAFMGGYHWWVIARSSWLIFPFVISAMLLPVVSLHFYLVFPRPKKWLVQHRRWVLAGVYAVPVVWLVLTCTWTWHASSLYWHGQPVARVNQALGTLLMLVSSYFGIVAVWFLASLGCLAHSYRTSQTVAERNQVKWILAAAAMATIPLSYSLWLFQTDRAAFGTGGATLPMFIASLLFILAFAVSITRYRLMQVDEILNRGMIYVGISFAATGLYCGTVGLGTLLVGQYFEEFSRHVLAVAVTAMVLAAGLGWLRDRFQQALDRRFYREKYQLDRAMRRMSEAVDNLVGTKQLAERFLEALGDAFHATRGLVYLKDNQRGGYALAAAIGVDRPPPVLPEGSPLVQTLQHETLVETNWLGGSRPAAALEQLRHLGGQLAQALELDEQLVGVWVLGGRRGATQYGAEELAFLSVLARMAALALHSAEGRRSVEGLTGQLREHVEQIAEQRRRIVALQTALMSREPPPSVPAAGIAGPAEGNSAPLKRAGVKGSSAAMEELLRTVQKVSRSNASVLIRGESGTGKGVVAATIHANSLRASGPFVAVHCAALSPGLLESELFGHVKGAFTGAHRDKVGRFELADGGTLFLDEIGDVSPETQTKLLRVLEEMAFERVGSTETRRVDVRLIAATHQNLEALIRAGRFREDLFYRLNVISLFMPPLRDRKEDIFELAIHFLELHARQAQKPITSIDEEALNHLLCYRWPGNVRELENVIERAVALAEGESIGLAELPPEIQQAPGTLRPVARPLVTHPPDMNGTDPFRRGSGDPFDPTEPARPLPDQMEQRERQYLLDALERADGNKARAARLLGIPRSTFFSKLKKLGIG